jgi:hypothetical protein
MFSAARLRLREARLNKSPWPASETSGRPPLMPVAAGGLSGRPRCRIFPVGRLWVLQMETPSGWLIGDVPVEPPPRLTFPTLAAAIAHAELHGYDYRIVTPSPVVRIPERSRRISGANRTARYGSATGHNNMEH